MTSSILFREGAVPLSENELKNNCALRSFVYKIIGSWSHNTTKKKGFDIPFEFHTIDKLFKYARTHLNLEVLQLSHKGKMFITFILDKKHVCTHMLNTDTSLDSCAEFYVKYKKIMYVNWVTPTAPCGYNISGNEVLEALQSFAQKLGMKYIVLEDGSNVSCGKENFFISLRFYKLLSQGKTWYESKGFTCLPSAHQTPNLAMCKYISGRRYIRFLRSYGEDVKYLQDFKLFPFVFKFNQKNQKIIRSNPEITIQEIVTRYRLKDNKDCTEFADLWNIMEDGGLPKRFNRRFFDILRNRMYVYRL